MHLVLADNSLREAAWEHLFSESQVNKKKDPINFTVCVDKRVGVPGLVGAHVPVEGINLGMVEVLTTDHDCEQRAVLYTNSITRTGIGAAVRQRYRYPH